MILFLCFGEGALPHLGFRSAAGRATVPGILAVLEGQGNQTGAEGPLCVGLVLGSLEIN